MLRKLRHLVHDLSRSANGVAWLHLRVCGGGVGRSGQNRGLVLDELQSTVESAAAEHVEGNIGIAVVDSVPTGAPGDDWEDDHAETVYKARRQESRHNVRLPMVRIGAVPLSFISRTAATGSR